MSRLTKKSAWTFGTSLSASVSFGGSLAKGKIFLKDPSNSEVSFGYMSLGYGLSGGIKKETPRLDSISSKEMPSTGQIWLLDSFHGQELTSADIAGYSIITEISGFAAVGGSFTVMWLGIPLYELPLEGLKRGFFRLAVSDDPLESVVGLAGFGPLSQFYIWDFKKEIRDFLDSRGAKAVLFMAGAGIGGVGGGVTESVGVVSRVGTSSKRPPPIEVTVGPEQVSIKSSNTAHQSAIFLSGDILFCFDDSHIQMGAEPILKRAGTMIKAHPGSFIEVNGYTDNIGDKFYNLALSERRANSVAAWLASHGYTVGHSVLSAGLGITNRFGSNIDEAGRKKNRMVEIKIHAGGGAVFR